MTEPETRRRYYYAYPIPADDLPPDTRRLVHADGREWTRDELRDWALDHWAESGMTRHDVDVFADDPCRFLDWAAVDDRIVSDSDDMMVVDD